LVFIGNLFYPPNRQGLAFFCRNIWPEIIAQKPATKLLIIGHGGVKFFGTKKNTDKNIEILGWLDNPYPLLTQQALFISPADFGAGLPTKSLLAMALGLPVVSTLNNSAGIEGIIDNKNICLVDYQKIRPAAEKIIRLLADEEARKKIGQGGKELIFQKYRQAGNYPLLKSFLTPR
jgi:glycosyltransferase involved in cell wall biosynthesis